MGAGQITRLNVTAGHLPQGYQLSTYDNLLQDFAARLVVSPNQAYSTFFYGPTAPTTDQGPWFNTLLNEWWVWDTSIGAYRAERPSSITGEVDIGTVISWAGNIAGIATYWGTRWKHCDGAALSRTDFMGLFARIGVQYGPGDGSTTFNIPDFRNYFLVGASSDDSGTAKSIVGDGATLLKSRAFTDHSHALVSSMAFPLPAATSGGSLGPTGTLDTTWTTASRALPPFFALPFVIRVS